MIIKFSTKKLNYCDCSGNKDLWLYSYRITDPSHDSGPPLGIITDRFNRGDIIDIAFPIQSPDNPVYSDVQAAATVGDKDWHIQVFYDSTGVDFGTAYRVMFTALRDNIVLDNFRIYFMWHGTNRPGSQPWGFTAANDPGQHTELGQTIPLFILCLPIVIVKLCNIVGCPPTPYPWLWSERPAEKFVKLMSEKKQDSAKLQRIKDEAARLVKRIEKATADEQTKIAERAEVLLENLRKLGFEEVHKPVKAKGRKRLK